MVAHTLPPLVLWPGRNHETVYWSIGLSVLLVSIERLGKFGASRKHRKRLHNREEDIRIHFLTPERWLGAPLKDFG
jgi:hypothetical protein